MNLRANRNLQTIRGPRRRKSFELENVSGIGAFFEALGCWCSVTQVRHIILAPLPGLGCYITGVSGGSADASPPAIGWLALRANYAWNLRDTTLERFLFNFSFDVHPRLSQRPGATDSTGSRLAREMGSALSLYGCIYVSGVEKLRSNSGGVTVAVPNLPTTIPLAWLETSAASVGVSPALRARAKRAMAVSPAPETS